MLRPSQGFWGTGKEGYLFQGNKGKNLRGTREQRQYWGTGNIRKQIFDFWGKSQFISGEQENRYPPGRASLLLRSAMAGRLFKHQSKHTSNSGFVVGNPNRKKMHIFGFVGIFEYIC